MRRSDRNQRVIGTLLGNIKDNIVEVRLYYNKTQYMFSYF